MKAARRRRGGVGEQLLTQLLEAFEGAQAAQLVIDAALVDSLCDEVPDDSAGLLLFARDHVAPRIARRSGARMAASWVERLEALVRKRGAVSGLQSTSQGPLPVASQVGSGVRVRRIGVLLIEPIAVLRAGLARALVQGQCDVTTVADAAGATAYLAQRPELDVLILDPTNVEQANLARTLPILPRPLALVAWSSRTQEELEPLLTGARARLVAVAPRGASDKEVMFIVRQAAPARGRRDEA